MRIVLALLLILSGWSEALAEGKFGTRDEAVSLVRRGIAHVAAVGPARAFSDFSAADGGFIDRDLYLIVTDLHGTRVAHGENLRLVGRNIVQSTDIAGKNYGLEIVAGAKSTGSGWIDYLFSDPVTKKILPKTSYFERAGDYIFYCGIYKR